MATYHINRLSDDFTNSRSKGLQDQTLRSPGLFQCFGAEMRGWARTPCPEGAPISPLLPMTPALALGSCSGAAAGGCVHGHNPRPWVRGEAESRPRACSRLDSRPGLAPIPSHGPQCAVQSSPGLSPAPRPGLASSAEVEGRGLEAQHQERARPMGV